MYRTHAAQLRELNRPGFNPGAVHFHNRHTNPQRSRGGGMSRWKRDGNSRPYWWQQLVGPDRKLPPSVNERLSWYENQVRYHRDRFRLFEIAIIVVSAAIPAAAAIGASAGIAGVLGALVTALVGVRQLYRWGEYWVRFSGSLMAMQREVVRWSVKADPYDADELQHADARLSDRVEALVTDETAQWSALQSAALSSQADATDGRPRAPSQDSR
jgi:Protein of unknown function (DUF4231)